MFQILGENKSVTLKNMLHKLMFNPFSSIISNYSLEFKGENVLSHKWPSLSDTLKTVGSLMWQCGQIWLKLKAASKLISVNLVSTERGRESYRHKTNRIWVKSFKLICNTIDWRVEVAKHETMAKVAKLMRKTITGCPALWNKTKVYVRNKGSTKTLWCCMFCQSTTFLMLQILSVGLIICLRNLDVISYFYELLFHT